jgi:hypothetical protein
MRIWVNASSDDVSATTAVVNILNNGSVGIGTTSPSQKLDVNGNILTNSVLYAGSVSSTRITVDGGSIQGYFSSEANARFLIGRDIYTSGQSGIALGGNGSFVMIGDASGTAGTAMAFAVGAGSGGGSSAEKMRINSSGNVGIGTTSPSVKLQVVGDGLFNSNTNTNLTINSNGGAAALTLTNTAGSQVIYGGIGGLNVMDFYTNSAFRVRIDASGNVGIGTTSPTHQLSVYNVSRDSTTALNAGNSNIIPAISIQSGTGSWASTGNGFAYYYNTANGNLDLYRKDNSTTENHVMTWVRASGNVGIGSTSPGAKLDVTGNVRATSFTGSFSGSLTGLASNATIATYVNGTSGQLYSKDDRIIEPNSISNGYMQFGFTSWGNDNGSPYADYLHLRSYTDASGGSDNLLMFLKSGFGIRTWQQTFNSSSAYASYRDVALISGSSVGYVPFWTQTNQLLNSALYFNGTNVGIGTTSPAAKLDVSGDIFGRGVIFGYASSTQYGGLSYGLLGSTDGFLFLKTGGTTTVQLQASGSSYFNAGNVGIGTTSPNAKLDVNGNVYVGGANGAFASSGRGLVEINGSTNSLLGLTIGNVARGYLYHDGSNLTLYNYTGNTYLANGSGNILTINGANVGIGTTSPSYKLDVNGAIKASGTLYSDNGSLAGSLNLGQVVSLGSSFSSYASLVFTMHNGGGFSDIMKLQGNGNVGIGTTSPQVRFSVQGSQNNTIAPANAVSKFVGGDAGVFIGNLAGTPNYGAWLQAMRESDGFTFPLHLQPNGGSVGIGTTSPAYKLDVTGNIHSTTTMYIDASNSAYLRGGDDHEWWDINVANTVGLYGVSNSAVGAIKLGSGGPTLYGASGNLAIGTTSPGARLTIAGPLGSVVGGGSSAIRMTNTDTGNYASIGAGIVGITNAGMQLSVDGTSSMVINSNGNVGIGLVSPGYPLEISSTAVLSLAYQRTGVSAKKWGFDSDNSNTYWYNITDNIRSFTLSNGGNVGIGSTSPAYKLEVNGATGISGQTTVTSDSVEQIIIRRSSNTNQQLLVGRYSSYGYLQAVTQGSSFDPLILNPNGGSVGIGTTSPTSKLHVSVEDTGNTYPSSASINIANYQSAAFGRTMGINFGVGNSSPAEYIAGVYGVYTSYSTSVGGALAFITNNGSGLFTEKMRITSAGNVGIGSTSPAYKLDVNGTFRSNAFWTDGTAISYWGSGATPTAYGGLTWDTGFAQVYATNGNALRLGANGANAHMYINTSGNVGIGTTSPNSRLEVYGGSLAAGGGGMMFASQLTTGRTGTYDAGTLQSIHNYFDSSTVEIAGGSSSGWVSGISVTGNNATNFQGTIRFTTISAERMRITNGGNVGIGTTSPSAQLHVRSTTGNTSAPTLFLSQADGVSQNYGQIVTGDQWHGLILRGIPSNATNYGVTAGDQMSFFEYGDDFRFYKKDGSVLTLQGRLNAGTWTVTGDIVAYGSPSDITLKTNIKPLQGALETITKLQGVSFTWKEDTDVNKMTGITDDIGFIAQEVQEVLPGLVRKNDNGLLSLRDKGITALLVEAIKEQQKQIDDLKYLLSQK